MNRHTSYTNWLVLLLVAVAAATTFAQSGDGQAPNPLYTSPSEHDFSANPALLQRILDTPHGYFRFINIIFSQEVCRRFEAYLTGTPTFNLHGDAHIEQYAITDLGRGLTDFDDSSTGPAIIDLMRFGVSLQLACLQNQWQDEADNLYDRFLDGYRASLKNPKLEAPVPALVTRIKREFKFERAKYFEWVEQIMKPIPQAEETKLVTAMKTYIEAMRFENPELAPGYLGIKQVGYLQLGIGSAQDLKYLVRVEGETTEPLDDVVLEVKQVRDLSGISCITIAQSNDPFRVLVGQARIAYEPYRLLGYIRMDSISFWVHSWVDNYKEIEIAESFQSVEEIAEIAYDVGVQLGRGHTNQIASPLDVQLRREQLRLLAKHESQLKAGCKKLRDLTIMAWERFREEAESGS